MATKSWYLTATTGNSWRTIDESTQTAATNTDGWTVSTGSTNSSEFFVGVKRAASTFTGTSVPDGSLDTTNFDAFRSTNAYTGNFESGNWTFNFVVRGPTSATGQDGRVVFRLFKANADGSSAVEITSGQQSASTIGAISSTTTDMTSTLTVNPGAFYINNQYIFIQVAWQRTVAASMTTADIQFRTGSATTTGTRIVSANFVPDTPISNGVGSMSLAGRVSALATSIAVGLGTLALAGLTTATVYAGPDNGTLSLTGRTPTVAIGGSSNTTITVPNGSLSAAGTLSRLAYKGPSIADVVLAGQAPSVAISTGPVTPIPAGALILAGQTTATVYAGPDYGALSLAGLAPSVSVGNSSNTTIAVPVGTLTLAGKLFRLAYMGPSIAALSLTGQAPAATVSSSGTIAIPAGTLAFTGRTPSLSIVGGGTTIAIPVGAVLIDGQYVAVSIGDLPPAALTLTGLAPTLVRLGVISPATGTLAFAGQTTALNFTGPNTGALAFAGQAPIVGINSSGAIQIPVGTLTLEGQYTGLAFIDPPVCQLIITGRTPTVAIGGSSPSITPGVGALALSGQAALTATKVALPLGALTLVGQTPVIARQIIPPAGALAFTGQVLTVVKTNSQVATPSAGTLTLIGLAPNVLIPNVLTPGQKALSLAGPVTTVSITYALTRITGSIYDTLGNKRTMGTLYLKPNNFIRNGNNIIAPFTIAYSIPGTGNIDLLIAPSVDGVTYKVEFDPNPADTSTPMRIKDGYFKDTWLVPTTSSIDIAAL